MPSTFGNTPLGTSIALESDLQQSLTAVTGKPYDAECEYVTFPTGAYVDPGIVDIGMPNAYDVDASIRVPTFGFFRFGNWRGNSQSKSFMIYSSSTGYRCAKYWTDSNDPVAATSNFFQIKTTAGNYTINGTTRNFAIPSGANVFDNARFLLCALDNKYANTVDPSQVSVDIAYFRFIGNSVFRDFIPVRVGQVGYLYDKVTGQLFGSATSTALVPGPDVANPTFTPKTEIDLLAPLASPAFTGTPTAPTAAPGTNTTQVATTAFVQTALSGKSSISSPDGNTSVAANNDGTATLTVPLASLAPPLLVFDNFSIQSQGTLSNYTATIQTKGPFTFPGSDDTIYYVPEDEADPTGMADLNNYEICICRPVSASNPLMLFTYGGEFGTVSDIDTTTPGFTPYGTSSGTLTITRASSKTTRLATADDIGDINSVLDAINGESV